MFKPLTINQTRLVSLLTNKPYSLSWIFPSQFLGTTSQLWQLQYQFRTNGKFLRSQSLTYRRNSNYCVACSIGILVRIFHNTSVSSLTISRPSYWMNNRSKLLTATPASAQQITSTLVRRARTAASIINLKLWTAFSSGSKSLKLQRWGLLFQKQKAYCLNSKNNRLTVQA